MPVPLLASISAPIVRHGYLSTHLPPSRIAVSLYDNIMDWMHGTVISPCLVRCHFTHEWRHHSYSGAWSSFPYLVSDDSVPWRLTPTPWVFYTIALILYTLLWSLAPCSLLNGVARTSGASIALAFSVIISYICGLSLLERSLCSIPSNKYLFMDWQCGILSKFLHRSSFFCPFFLQVFGGSVAQSAKKVP